MPPDETQLNLEEMTPEEAKAALGLSTRLTEQFLMSQVQQNAPQEGTGEAETPQGEELDLETEETPPIDPEALKNEILGDIKKDLPDMLKGVLKELLDEDEDETTKTSE